MTKSSIDNLEPQARQLLQADRDIPQVSAEIAARLEARLHESVRAPLWTAPAEPASASGSHTRRRWLGVAAAVGAAAAVAVVVSLLRSSRPDESAVAAVPELTVTSVIPPAAARPASRPPEIRLQLLDVDPDSMAPLLGRFQADPPTRELGIVARTETWRLRAAGRVETAWYLAAPDPQPPCDTSVAAPGSPSDGCPLTGTDVLQQYLDQLFAAEPALAVPHRELLLGRYPASPGKPGGARTYLLQPAVVSLGLVSVAISHLVDLDADVVCVELDEASTATAASFARQFTGRQVAVVAGGQVVLAPVLVSVGAPGQLLLNPGGATQEARRDRLAQLVQALGGQR